MATSIIPMQGQLCFSSYQERGEGKSAGLNYLAIILYFDFFHLVFPRTYSYMYTLGTAHSLAKST